MNVMKIKLLNIFVAALLLIIFGCSQDAHDIGNLGVENGNVIFSIIAMEQGNHFSKASEGDYNIPSNELINDWWVVFVETNTNRVAKILFRKDANPGLGSNTDMPPVEEELFETDLAAGHYNVYAFANISPQLLEESTGLSFNIGDNADQINFATWKHSADGNETEFTPDVSSSDDVPSSNISSNDTSSDVSSDTYADNYLTLDGSEQKRPLVNKAIIDGSNLNLWNAQSNIPMCGFLKNIEVKNTVEETFSIEVVRMVAKIEFEFSNKTENEITINSVSLDPVTSSAVSLMPDYSCLGIKSYTPLADPISSYGLLTYSPASAITLTASNLDDAQKNCFFYCKESVTNHPTNKFTIGVNISRKNNGKIISTEELHYSPTEMISDYINRNDWIKIPISFTDWIVDFQVRFYPPIGGYPAVSNWAETNSDSHYFTFGSQGTFIIIPKIRKANDGSSWLLPEEYISKNNRGEFVASNEKLNIVVAPNNADIFYDVPTIDKKTGEITGRLNEMTGTALITVYFKLDNGQIVSRKLYIIRKNSI